MTEPKYPNLHIVEYIKIEETDYVSDELVPTLQFNISVSKEALQDHKTLWLQYYKEYNEYSEYMGKKIPPEDSVNSQITRTLVEEFESYLWNRLNND